LSGADSLILRYFAATDGRGTTRLVGSIFQPEKYGIVFVDGSERVEPVNRVLLELREEGRYDEIYRRWFGTTAGDG
jgi:ABC-type amino acid transport substrate-binding protein